MSRSKGFWKVAETNQSPGSGPLHAAVDICDSLACLRMRGVPSPRYRNARRAASPRGSETERGAHWDHWRAAGVDGVDDLGVVDALEVDRGDAEVAVAELALDDDERHAFVSHLDPCA